MHSIHGQRRNMVEGIAFARRFMDQADRWRFILMADRLSLVAASLHGAANVQGRLEGTFNC